MPDKKKVEEPSVKDQITHLLISDKELVQTIAKTISSCIVEHLLESQDILKSIVSSIIRNDEFQNAIGRDGQEIYNSVSLDIKNSEKKIEALQEHCDKLKETVTVLEDELDQQQQKSRRNCLLIHGMAETEQETTDEMMRDLFKGKLLVNVEETDIDRSHRIGKIKKDKSRPIIVKFTSYNKRHKVFMAKQKIKGLGIVITESLTTRVNNMDHEATWTMDGRKLCLLKTEIK